MSNDNANAIVNLLEKNGFALNRDGNYEKDYIGVKRVIAGWFCHVASLWQITRLIQQQDEVAMSEKNGCNDERATQMFVR